MENADPVMADNLNLRQMLKRLIFRAILAAFNLKVGKKSPNKTDQQILLKNIK